MKVGLTQFNYAMGDQYYFPYSAGCLMSYANHAAPDLGVEYLDPLYRRMPIEEAVEALISSDLVGMSLYVWNEQFSLAVARRLKERRPDVLIFVGGPQTPDRSEAFLRKHPYIDIACHNEGERVFVEVLRYAKSFHWTQIPSVSFLDADGEYQMTERVGRMKDADLAQVPSPYLSGVFDSLMENNPGVIWQALWETNRGCPYSCDFCDWGSAIGQKFSRFDENILRQEIEWFASHGVEFIFCCDANFGIIPRDIELARYAAEVKARYGLPHRLSVQAAKNAGDNIFEVQTILSESGLQQGALLAFQSLHEPTLTAIHRDNIKLSVYRELQRRYTAVGIPTVSDYLLGLPEETYDSYVDGIATAIMHGQHNRIQFGNLSLLPNAEMGNPAYQKRYEMESVTVHTSFHHGSIDGTVDGIPELEELVISTSTMSREDWAKARAYAWMVSLLHFDKLLQIPLVVLNKVAKVPYRWMFEQFLYADKSSHPLTAYISQFFIEKARRIQRGEVEYCAVPEWLNLYWPADEYIFIQLYKEGVLQKFYEEALDLLLRAPELQRYSSETSQDVLKQSVYLNHMLMRLPRHIQSTASTTYNIWELYRSVLEGTEQGLVAGQISYELDHGDHYADFEDWLRHVVWFGYKRGAYIGSVSKTRHILYSAS
ncbi:MAG: cobalamin-dependent protein [bacterium]|nr:cobalamin-dependent protein [bacterium]